MDIFPINMDEFNLSFETGFLLHEPLERLPEYFESWNGLAKEMPVLVTTRRLRDAVHELEVLDHRQLNGHRQHRLAHLQLSIIASGYIWQEGDKGAAKVLPACLSVPWVAVSTYLGIQPVLNHASFVLANWKYLHNGGLQSLYRIPGGEEADWFITVTVQMELDFAEGLWAVMCALFHSQRQNAAGLTDNLNKVTATIHTMKKTLSTMHDKLTGETFYNLMRPFLTGWGGSGSPLPDGIIYEGVSDQPRKMTGGSAAQSSTLQCVDAALGVVHQPDKREFMSNMRLYMPPAHRKFLETIETHSTIKQTVANLNCDKLTSAYNQCVTAVVDFRTYHIQVVTKYIVIMANRANRNKEYEALAKTGTGGSSILPFLRCLRSTTTESMVPSDRTIDQDPANSRDTENTIGRQDPVSSGDAENTIGRLES